MLRLKRSTLLVYFGSLSVILLFLIPIGAPTLLDSLLRYEDVIGIELPKGVVVDKKLINTQGKDRKHFDCRFVFKGDSKVLLEYIRKLGLNEENNNDHAVRRCLQTVPRKWKEPPSSESTKKYRFFRRSIGNTPSESQFCVIEVLLTDNDMYLFKLGNLALLREKIREKGFLYRLL
jgi:hypothetical protein